jgi:hypothetical protein
MIELFGTAKEQQELQREAADRAAAPQTAALIPTITTSSGPCITFIARC